MPRKQIENTIPVLAVRDLERSVEFFQRVLGFELEWNSRPVCSVGRDGSSIMLHLREHVERSTVWIGLDDDSMFGEIQKSGAEVVQPPSNMPWA